MEAPITSTDSIGYQWGTGYWGLYLVGVQLGHYIFFGNNSQSASRSNKAAFIKTWLLVQPGLCYMDSVSEPTGIPCNFDNRNLSIFGVAMGIGAQNNEYIQSSLILLKPNVIPALLDLGDLIASNLIGGFMLTDYIPGSKISALEEAFNRNLLASFVLANIFTGLVNLTTDTLSTSTISAIFLLLGYTFCVSMIIGIADFYGIRLKFW
ncbi:hypothetical protein WN943_018744 [Citrus x changshan-huyou]